MRDKPAFFLTAAGEYEPLASPRACWEVARLADNVRDDHMLIEIEPSLDGQRFGLGDAEITRLIISARHRGQSLYPMTEWPSFVYVSRVLDETIVKSKAFRREQIELIAWATLFRTLDLAVEHQRRIARNVG